jgi:hypothetical protein
LGRFFGVSGGESDDRRHDDAPVAGQSLGDTSGAFLVTQIKTDTGFELVGAGQKDGVVAFECRARRGQRAKGFVEVATGGPDPGPV